MVFLPRLCQIIHVGCGIKLHIECLSIAIVPDGGASCQTDGGGTRQPQLDLSTLNRRLAALERDLSTKLFDRGVSGYTVMPHDGRLLKHAQEIALGKGASC